MTPFRRFVAIALCVGLTQGALLQGVYATTLSAEQVAAAMAGTSESHTQLHAALDRADLASALQARGVSVDSVRDRVNALTDAEAAQVLAQIDAAPAGASALGVIFSIFIVLLVTDILGFTKIFPFTRSVR